MFSSSGAVKCVSTIGAVAFDEVALLPSICALVTLDGGAGLVVFLIEANSCSNKAFVSAFFSKACDFLRSWSS